MSVSPIPPFLLRWPQFTSVQASQSSVTSQAGGAESSLPSQFASNNAAFALAKLLTQASAQSKALQAHLARAVPGGPDSFRAIVHFIVAAHTKDLSQVFSRSLEERLKNALSPTQLARWKKQEQIWLRHNPQSVYDQLSQSWRFYQIPWWQEGKANILRVFFRPTRTKEKSKQREKGQILDEENKRFVLELHYTAWGPIQIEGLVYESEKRLWLLVRSEHGLAPKLQQSIRSMFISSLSSERWSATITFRTVAGYRPLVAGVSGEMSTLI